MVDWNEVAGELMTQGMRILLPVCIALILKWAGELWLKLKGERPEISELLSYAVSIATRAAEQEYGGKHGEEKKQYAIDFVQKFLAENGLKIDVSVIASAVESAVFTSNQFKRFASEDESNE